ncbi:MAG: nucleotidyltransferase family protein [Nanoarchaeota archaeon]|nr:nucleotidyltransferase family protein [Nanoarchaeota archaeon]
MKTIKEIEKKIIPILRKNKVKRAGIFGSHARGEQKKSSDVDILVELDEKLDLYDVIGIKLELEKVLKKKVDLVEYDTIRKELRDNILREEIPIEI